MNTAEGQPGRFNTAEVIDLTASDDLEEIPLGNTDDGIEDFVFGERHRQPPRRLPRRAEVIDLEAPRPPSLTRQHAIDVSEPDVQFVGERLIPGQRFPPRATVAPPPRPAPRPTQYLAQFPTFNRMHEFMFGAARHPAPHPPRNPTGEWAWHNPLQNVTLLSAPWDEGQPYAHRIHRHPGEAAPFHLPGALNYAAAAFDINIRPPPEPPRASPILEPLPPARDGFTRSPAEGDALVCPSCGDELCTGDDDLKRQVWVIKSCGHVRLLPLLQRCMLTRDRSTAAAAARSTPAPPKQRASSPSRRGSRPSTRRIPAASCRAARSRRARRRR